MPRVAALPASTERHEPELHTRTVIPAAGHWFYDCSCGFFSGGFVLRHDAEIDPCPVKGMWLSSAERRAVYGMRTI